MSETEVFVLLTGANEGSTPLEAASHVQADDIHITVADFFDADGRPYGVEINSFDADSKYDIGSYLELYRVLRERRPDVLHVHPIAIGAVATFVGRLAGIDCIVATQHSQHDGHGPVKQVVNGISNVLCNVVVNNSVATAESFPVWEDVLLDVSRTKRQVVHYGIDLESVNTVRQNSRTMDLPDGFLVGTSGRFVKSKGIDSLVRATARLVNTAPEIRLVLAGDGPERSNLESLAAELGVSDNVIFLGWLSERERVYEFLDTLDVFAFPTRYEGFGVSNAEAMAMGTPVVVNDLPVLREVVGEAGLFVDATDPESLADGINELYDNPAQRQRLGERAAERIREQFSLASTVKEYNEVYRTCAGR